MNKFFIYFSFAMGAVFMCGGILLALFPPPQLADPWYYKYLAGFICFMYGFFRLSRAYYMNKRKDHFEDQ